MATYMDYVKDRYTKTTVGEWVVDSTGDEWGVAVNDKDNGYPMIGCGMDRTDAEFIAHAHQDMPVLLARIARLEREVAMARHPAGKKIKGR